MRRPLQLPTTTRRLFGAVLAAKIGPLIEARLSKQQAAKAGGTCGPNIAAAYQHLDSQPEAAPDPTALWRTLMGDLADDIDETIAALLAELTREEVEFLARGPAAVEGAKANALWKAPDTQ